ncbi:MAG: PhoU domain-containing protein [Acidimicrobiales bacterium]|jgi:phosphate uptake regulator|nr:PhoU domain-containing protein [Acidimicrobiales bacterium]
MVLSFFRAGDTGLDHVVTRSVAMVNDARHSFDLACTALMSGADPKTVSEDVRETDLRINANEQQLRGELAVHISVHGPNDIGEVIGLILLLKKIERVGDHAKNILDLAESGVSFANEPDIDELLEERRTVSGFFAEASEILAEHDGIPEGFRERLAAMTAQIQARIDNYMTSDEPGYQVVPRAVYHRYLKRIVANLNSAVLAATEPVRLIDPSD